MPGTSGSTRSAGGDVTTDLDPFRLDGKVLLVTGGSKGIGLAIAAEAARAGARGVVIAARNPAELRRAQTQVEEAGARCLAVAADCTNEEDIAGLVGRAIHEFQGVDVLVNNIGGARFVAPIRETRVSGWRKALELNLTSAFLMIHAVLGTWSEPKPGRSIVNVGSTSALRAWPDLSAYSTAKLGLIGLTRNASRELAPEGIRVNLVCPHLIETPLTEGYRRGPEYDELVAEIPLGRWGNVDEVARVVRFVASDAASFITGATLTVDGGWSA